MAKKEPKITITIFSHREQSYLEPVIHTGAAAKKFLRNIPDSWMFESKWQNFENYTNSRGDNIRLEFTDF